MNDEKELETVIWHQQSSLEVAKKLQSAIETGLSEEEARRRLQEYGKNQLAEAKPRPPWLKFLDQFRSFLVLVLLFAAILAWAIGDLKDAIVILVVTLFNSTLGFYQEHRAEQTLAALKGMLSNKTRVKRDGHIQEIDPAFLVPGDLVLLEAGDQVPADGRVVEAHNLEVAEAALTGESHSVGKTAEAEEKKELPLGDRKNMLFMNTVLSKGRGVMIVTTTGAQTEMGKIAGMIAAAPESKTPLQEQLDVLGKRLALIAVLVIAVILGLDFFRGIPFFEAAMTAVALAVAAIPEGLPAVVTVTLAIGMWRMAQNKAILKKLSAVETLGSTTAICSDKTGTLTMNQMKARTSFYSGKEFSAIEDAPTQEMQRDFLIPMILCSEASVLHGELIGDPTETALLEMAISAGLNPEEEKEKQPRIAEIPFDSEHKFMATFHHCHQEVEMLIKGAPDVLLGKCRFELIDGQETELCAEKINRLAEENISLAARGLRVLAIARKRISSEVFSPSDNLWPWCEDWTLVGMVGIMDPPRPEAKEAIALCQRAGIQVKMITGDHKVTAASIARELGLKGDVILGSEVEGMNLEELAAKSGEIAVFARVSPEHKVKIVKALKSIDHVTAMTGDGVNDAPALKTADIGVAMGITGTAVTKEAATLVLTDDNFATIVRAVKEGRVIYDNIVKFVRFQLSTNIGAILTVFTATVLGLPTPFTPIQLLWINIIMDGPPAMTLGVEKAREGIMDSPPRPRKEHILTPKRLGRLVFYGLIMMVGTLGIYQYGLANGDSGLAMTLAFTTFVLFQFFNVFNAREEFESAFNRNFFRNGKLWLSLLGVVLLQVIAVHWEPAREIFNTQALTLDHWALVVLVSSSVLFLEEIRKFIFRMLAR